MSDFQRVYFLKGLQKICISLLIGLLLGSISCNFAYQVVAGQSPPATPVRRLTQVNATPLPTLTEPAQREACLEDEIYHPSEGLCYSEDESLIPIFFTILSKPHNFRYEEPEIKLKDETNLVTYQVDDNQIINPTYDIVSSGLYKLQHDVESQLAIWNYFAAIIPSSERSEITQFSVFTDGKDGTLAAIEQTPKDPYQWQLGVDPLDSIDVNDLTYNLLHEFGHLLTLNASQVPPDLKVFEHPYDDEIYKHAIAACTTYFPGEGCSNQEAYINQFFERFWKKIFSEWLGIHSIESDDDYYDALKAFYKKYQDQFVSEYAVTDPAEDIAESWMMFVLSPQPSGNSIADLKIMFFYDFPELVQLRKEIILRTYSRLERLQ